MKVVLNLSKIVHVRSSSCTRLGGGLHLQKSAIAAGLQRRLKVQPTTQPLCGYIMV